MLEVVEASHAGGYKVRLVLNDGATGVVDLKDSLWGEAFEPIRDLEQFRLFEVSPEMRTIVWPHGVDFAPEHLKKKMLEQAG